MHPSHNLISRHALDEDVRTLAGLAARDSRRNAPPQELLAELPRTRSQRPAAAEGGRSSWRSRVVALLRRPSAARC